MKTVFSARAGKRKKQKVKENAGKFLLISFNSCAGAGKILSFHTASKNNSRRFAGGHKNRAKRN